MVRAHTVVQGLLGHIPMMKLDQLLLLLLDQQLLLQWHLLTILVAYSWGPRQRGQEGLSFTRAHLTRVNNLHLIVGNFCETIQSLLLLDANCLADQVLLGVYLHFLLLELLLVGDGGQVLVLGCLCMLLNKVHGRGHHVISVEWYRVVW